MNLLRSRARGAAPGLRDRRGFALESTLIVLLVMSSLAVIAFAGVITTIRTTATDYRSTRVAYAAEAGAEAVMAELEGNLNDGVLSDAELAALTRPTMPGFVVDSFRAAKVGGIVTETITDGPFAGLYSLTQRIEIYSSAVDAQRHRAAVIVDVKAQAIPIFQFAEFYNGDMEQYPGLRKDILGRVHANGDAFLWTNGGSRVHFHDVVTMPGRVIRKQKIAHTALEPDCCPWVYNAADVPVALDFDSEDTPNPAAFRAQSEAKFDSRLMTGAHGVDTLRLPLPVGVPQREVIRPREAGDTPEEQETKFAWKADMYVTVDMTDIRDHDVVCGGGNSKDFPNITIVRYDGGVVPGAVDKCAIFDFKWDAFRDRFEGRWVDAVTVQMNQLRTWALGTAVRPEVIYIEFKTPAGGLGGDEGDVDPQNDNPGPGNGRPFPVLRLRSGTQLHGPLTIGSEYPLYIQGDYNTVAKQPAAVFGDVFTALSGAWNDAGNPGLPLPHGSNMSQNFSMITGTGQGYSGCYHHDPGCVNGGGVLVGSMRHLEQLRVSSNCGFGSCLYRWRGSFVSLFSPTIAKASHPTPPSCSTCFYEPPTRDWGFDVMLKYPDSLPPATPVVGNVIHTGFRPVF